MICGLVNPAVHLKKLIAIAGLLAVSALVFAQRPVPELWGMRVHDEARVLSQQTVQQLESQLKLYEDSTSNQIAILIIPSLNGEVLEEYALRVAEYWKLGQQEKDNGVLLFIAVEDRAVRIEVGYGLEGVLPDAICNRIIRNEIIPNFRRNDFDAGVMAAISALIQAIGGEYVSNDDGTGNVLSWKEQALLGVFVFTILGVFTFIGLKLKGGQGWFLYVFLIPFYAAFPGSILGFDIGIPILVGYVVLWPILKLYFKRRGWDTMESSSGSSSRGGGWSSGRGWSSGGGGFSGGGGSFGGGGSSGRW